MFEDILSEEEIIENVDIESYSIKAYCPFCGSKNIDESTPGRFLPGKMFEESVYCLDCNKEWKVIYDKDTNIIEVRECK